MNMFRLIHVNGPAINRFARAAGTRMLWPMHDQYLGGHGMKSVLALLTGAVFFCGTASVCAQAVDADAAQSLMKKSNCFKCHSIDKKKEGPPYHEVAEKLKGKADAEQKLFVHLTTHPKVKVDGKEEEHASLKTTDDAQIKNVIRFILSQ